MIQGGDPSSKLNNDIGPGETLQAEFNDIKHHRGIVSAARTNDPDSARSQFFVVHGKSNFLNEKYTVFGRIITDESYSTLDKIASLGTTPSDRPTDIEQTRIFKTEILNRNQLENVLELDAPVRINPVVTQTIPAQQTEQTPAQQTEEQTTTPWLILGVIIPVGIGLAVFALKRRR